MTNIYNINNGLIEVYNLNPLEREIKDFKKQELLKLPEEERVIVEEPTKGWFTTKKGVIYECGSYILRKSKKRELESNRELLKQYILGTLHEDRLLIKEDNLFLFEPYNLRPTHKIQLTKDLYLATVLANTDYSDSFLQTENLDNIKHLFEISNSKATIDMEELYKVYKYITNDLFEYEETVKYLEDSTSIYQKIKKH